MIKTLKEILAEYGVLAVAIYLTLFAVVFVGAYLGIRMGWAPGGTVGNVGAWTAAYIVTKITQPIRIGATVVLATFFGRLRHRRIHGEAPAAPVVAASTEAGSPEA